MSVVRITGKCFVAAFPGNQDFYEVLGELET